MKVKFNQDYRFAINYEVQSVKKGDVMDIPDSHKGIVTKKIASPVHGNKPITSGDD